MGLNSGHDVVPVTEEENERQKNLFKGHVDGMVQFQPGGWFLTKPFTKYANAIYNFKFKPTDTLIMTNPKCGTTWLQEIIWTMKNNTNLDNPMAKMPINARSPFLEFDAILATSHCPSPKTNPELMGIFGQMCAGKNPDDGIFIQLAEAMPSPRTIKTHLPFSLIPKDTLDICKVVYMVRNPKDQCASFYHHSRILRPHDYVGTFDEFVDLMVQDKLLFAPFFTNIREALDRKGSQNLYICFFEDFKKDAYKEYQKLNSFLGLSLTEEEVKKIVEYTSFKAMKARDNVLPKHEDKNTPNPFANDEVIAKEGGFFRKGEAGGYKESLTAEQEKKIDNWIADRSKGLDIKFKYGSE